MTPRCRLASARSASSLTVPAEGMMEELLYQQKMHTGLSHPEERRERRVIVIVLPVLSKVLDVHLKLRLCIFSRLNLRYDLPGK